MEKKDIPLEVDFSSLVSGLMAEALASMGMLEHPSVKHMKIDLSHAQTVINTISMLKEKTLGNLTPEESGLIEEILHHLRMGYMAALKKGSLSGKTVGKDTGDIS